MNGKSITTSVSILVSSFLVFFLSYFKIKPGKGLIFIQSFAAGSFLGISIINFFPDAAKYADEYSFPFYSVMMLGTFVVFSLIELIFFSKYESKSINESDNPDDGGKDYSVFLMHHFSVIPPSRIIIIIIYLTFILHSILIGIANSLYCNQNKNVISSFGFVYMVLTIILEKSVEAFTLALIFKNDIFPLWVTIAISVVYLFTTPLTIIIFSLIDFNNRKTTSYLLSVSAGIFLFLGLLFWRRIFLTQFDWKRNEVIFTSLSFFIGLLLQNLAHINKNFGAE